MASLAISAVASFVNVVFPVATNTGCRHLFCVQRSLMAGVALDFVMSLTQREMRISLVVETNKVPLRLGMAAFAFLSQATFVHIVFSMATDTGTRRLIMECRALVAITTTNRSMACA